MVREIIKPTSESYVLHIPKEYINQEVEILILPFSYKPNAVNYDDWSNEELKKVGKIGFNSQSFVEDDEDYSKW